MVGSPLKTLSWLLVGISFLLAVLLRLIWLDHIPGINGDEAWYGVAVMQPLHLATNTPTGNLLNPFYVVPLFIIQKPFAPHFWILRSVSALCGIVLVFSGYFLLRRSLGIRSAHLFVLLSASVPILVAYSRFGWDVSQSGLASLFLLHFSLRKKWGSAIIVQAISLVIHLTNIFLVFIPSVLFLWDVYSRLKGSNRKILRWILISAVLLLLVGSSLLIANLEYIAGGLAALGMKELGGVLLRIQPAAILNRMLSGPGWINLFILYSDLISGTTIYRYLVGPVSYQSEAIHFLFFWVGVVPVILYGCWMGIRKRDYRAVGVVLGVMLGLVTMYLLFGTRLISPYTERYSQFLVVPTILLLVMGLAALESRASYILATFLSIFWTVSIVLNYFVPLHITGGNSHRTFRTAAVEPKQQVVDLILDHMNGSDRNTVILAEDWWLTLPIRYLLFEHDNITVMQYDSPENRTTFGNVLDQDGYVVTFAQSTLDNAIQKTLASCSCESRTILDYGDKPLIHVWLRLPK